MHASYMRSKTTQTTHPQHSFHFSTIPHSSLQHVSPERRIIAIIGFRVFCQTERCLLYFQDIIEFCWCQQYSQTSFNADVTYWCNTFQYVYKYPDNSSKEGVVVLCRADIVWSRAEYVLNDVNQIWNISKYQNNSNTEAFADLMSIKFDRYLNVRTTWVQKLLYRADIVWSRAEYADLLMSIKLPIDLNIRTTQVKKV